MDRKCASNRRGFASRFLNFFKFLGKKSERGALCVRFSVFLVLYYSSTMEQLWSPWRSQYIQTFGTAKEESECFLCAAAQLREETEQRLVIARGASCFAVMNKFPYNAGHLMVAPIRHIGELDALSHEELSEIMTLIRHSSEVLRHVFNPHGFNIGANLGRAAGAGLPGHLHFHLVPRWNGDTNFMPILADVKVVSESLAETRERMAAVFGELFPAMSVTASSGAR